MRFRTGADCHARDAAIGGGDDGDGGDIANGRWEMKKKKKKKKGLRVRLRRRREGERRRRGSERRRRNVKAIEERR